MVFKLHHIGLIQALQRLPQGLMQASIYFHIPVLGFHIPVRGFSGIKFSVNKKKAGDIPGLAFFRILHESDFIPLGLSSTHFPVFSVFLAPFNILFHIIF